MGRGEKKGKCSKKMKEKRSESYLSLSSLSLLPKVNHLKLWGGVGGGGGGSSGREEKDTCRSRLDGRGVVGWRSWACLGERTSRPVRAKPSTCPRRSVLSRTAGCGWARVGHPHQRTHGVSPLGDSGLQVCTFPLYVLYWMYLLPTPHRRPFGVSLSRYLLSSGCPESWHSGEVY
jgi:hypothetical protein